MKKIIILTSLFVTGCIPPSVDVGAPTDEQLLAYQRLQHTCNDESGEAKRCNSDSDCCDKDFKCIEESSLDETRNVCLYDPDVSEDN